VLAAEFVVGTFAWLRVISGLGSLLLERQDYHRLDALVASEATYARSG
jgi:hypothetical protein